MDIRWEELTKTIVAKDIRDKWWTKIFDTLANSKQRKYYYNLDYLEKRFKLFDQYSSQLTHSTAVAMAMFFQHLHYDPHIHGIDEQLTLSTFEQFASDASLDSKLVENVQHLLRVAIANCTQVHLTAGAFGNQDEHYFLDFETAILGSCVSDYADYAAKMRDEYGFMTDHEYVQLRLKVLKNFLKIPNIFVTEEFRRQYEEQARENIRQEIDNIDKEMQSTNQ